MIETGKADNGMKPGQLSRTARILDCTIRDGSYVVDYQFTVEDTFIIAAGLARAGIQRIEVGHGAGLNAQRSGKGKAAIADADYIRAACAAADRKALVGSFFIPGIGTEDSLREAAAAGLGFVRVGIDVDEYPQLERYVRLGRDLGLEVWGNLMKSYIVKPADFGDICRRVGEFGVAAVALVDSAGGMTPDDVAAYTSEAVDRAGVPLGFHGHNNLSLAVANCLRFVEEGGMWVDGSLSGLGRSGGNAATELLATLLTRRGVLACPLDWESLVEFADSVMEFSLPEHHRNRAVEIATGVNYFHSNFAPLMETAATEAQVPLFRAILALPASSRKKVAPEMAKAAAARAGDQNRSQRRVPLPGNCKSLERVQPASLSALADKLRVLKGKSLLQRIVSVAHAPGVAMRIGPLRTGGHGIVAHIEVSDVARLHEARAALDGVVDLWMVDKSLGVEDMGERWLTYEDDAVIATAVSDAVQMLVGPGKRVALLGDDARQRAAVSRLVQVEDAGPVDAMVACAAQLRADADDVRRVREGGSVLMVCPEALTEEAFALSRARGLHLWRLDCGAALVAEAERLAATYERFHHAAGEVTLPGDVHTVAGGMIGNAGDVVVDSIVKPRFILGEADGKGGVRPLEDVDSARSRAVLQWIVNQWSL